MPSAKEQIIKNLIERQERGTPSGAKTGSKVKAVFSVDRDLHTALKVYAAGRRVPMSELVEEAIAGYLAERGGGR
jgi:predicted HicB family RNase H-like nuclease